MNLYRGVQLQSQSQIYGGWVSTRPLYFKDGKNQLFIVDALGFWF